MREAARLQAETLDRKLTAAVAAQAERDGLLRRIVTADQRLAAARSTVTVTARTLSRGSAEVARLESLSLTRVLASLRGSRATVLDSERAQQKRAEYSHAVAVASRDAAEQEARRLRHALDGTIGADDRHAAARRAGQAWLLADLKHDRARQLTESAHRRGQLQARQTLTQQAIQAGRQALDSLSQARAGLSSANSWANIDVFAGGGFLADSAKRKRMEQAARQLHAAQTAMRGFSNELDDVGGPIEALQLDVTMTVLDTVFDNIFTDVPVQNRIAGSSDQVWRAHRAVAQRVSQLADELVAIMAERRLLEERREALLSAPRTAPAGSWPDSSTGPAGRARCGSYAATSCRQPPSRDLSAAVMDDARRDLPG